MDVFALGAIVPETAASFDAYWNSASVFGVETVISGTGDLAAFEARVAEVKASAEAAELQSDLQDSFDRYHAGEVVPEWTTVQLIVDDPVKGEGIATKEQLVVTKLGEILSGAKRRVDLISAYFVPGPDGTAFLSDLAKSGIEVNVLTNALNTTDVLLVHAGYTKYRRELLEAGVRLYELKLRGEPDSKTGIQLNPIGLSGASLHAKTFALDDQNIFIGSFNFDPRSAILNCEMGFLIDSPSLAGRISHAFDNTLDTVSYRPELTPEDKMIWREKAQDGEELIYQEEPGASWFQQISTVIIGVLPVEWML
jgi:putative cardiolipin synthase